MFGLFLFGNFHNLFFDQYHQAHVGTWSFKCSFISWFLCQNFIHDYHIQERFHVTHVK